MKYVDVFNGDADGICALHQLRRANPVEKPAYRALVTGVKRDINLLARVVSDYKVEPGDKVTVVDISLDKNRQGLMQLLDAGAEIIYFDHHYAGDIPQHDALQTYINTDADVCSSLLVNTYLNNQYLGWAVTAAYGDNLYTAAELAAQPLQCNTTQLEALKLLGTCINYNGYGATLDDLIFAPDALYQLIDPYTDPFDFIQNEPAYEHLLSGYRDDMAMAESLQAYYEDTGHALYVLPNEKWARRASGVYANQLTQQFPHRAHAMLTEMPDGFVVSVRAPLNNKTGADELCRQFETGGGRKAAAGINFLPASDYDRFLQAFIVAF